MEIKELTAILVVATVGCILVAGFIPVVGESVSATTTFENKGYYDMTYTETDNLVFKWEYTNPNQVKVNDEIVPLITANSTLKTIICGDDWLVRYAYNSTIGTFVQFYGNTGSQVTASVGNETDLTITCSSGSVSVVNTAETPDTFSTTYTHLYVVANSGNLVMKEQNTPAYLNGDSEIIAMGLSRVGTISNLGISITGNINDGFTWTLFRGSDVTFSNEESVYTTVSGYVDLYQLDKLTATATNSTGSSDLTYSYFIVPAEIVAEKAIHADDNTASIVSMIPFILIMGIVLMFVGVVLVRRYV